MQTISMSYGRNVAKKVNLSGQFLFDVAALAILVSLVAGAVELLRGA